MELTDEVTDAVCVCVFSVCLLVLQLAGVFGLACPEWRREEKRRRARKRPRRGTPTGSSFRSDLGDSPGHDSGSCSPCSEGERPLGFLEPSGTLRAAWPSKTLRNLFI